MTRTAKVFLMGTCLLAAPVAVWLAMDLWAVSPLRAILLPVAWAVGFQLLRRPGPAPAEAEVPQGGISRWALASWLISAGGLFLGGILRSPELVAISLLAGIAASAASAGGIRGLKHSLPPLALMAIVVPLPLGMEEAWTKWASDYSLGLASSYLDLRDVVHAVSGPWIELPDAVIPVEKVTDGIKALPLAVAGSILLAARRRRPHWHTILLALVSALVAMALYIAAITLGLEWTYTHARDVWQQPTKGLFILGFVSAAAIFIFCFDHLLAFFSTPRPRPAKRDPAERETPLRSSAPSYQVPARAAAAMFMAMAAPCAGSLRHFRDLVGVDSTAAQAPVAPLAAGALPLNLPEKIGPWTQQAPEDNPRVAFRFSTKANNWEFRQDSLLVTLSVHSPFRGFPSVENQYKSMGWHILSDTNETSMRTPTPPLRAFSLRKPRFERAETLCASIGPEGQWISSEPTQESTASLPRFLLKRTREFVSWIRHGTPPAADPTRSQILVHAVWTGSAPFQPDDQYSMNLLFDEARQILGSQFRDLIRKP